MEFKGQRGVTIPNKYLMQHLQTVINKWETGSWQKSSRINHLGNTVRYQPQKEYDPINMVAEATGTGTKKMKEILKGEGHTTFPVVDRIFTELDLTHLWYEDENLALAYSLVK